MSEGCHCVCWGEGRGVVRVGVYNSILYPVVVTVPRKRRVMLYARVYTYYTVPYPAFVVVARKRCVIRRDVGRAGLTRVPCCWLE